MSDMFLTEIKMIYWRRSVSWRNEICDVMDNVNISPLDYLNGIERNPVKDFECNPQTRHPFYDTCRSSDPVIHD
jgi:hypothetical protein